MLPKLSLPRLDRPELWLLAGFLVAAALLLLFGHIAEEVFEGDAAKFDSTILLAFRDPSDLANPIGPAWVEEMPRDITALGSYTVLGLLLAAVVAYLFMVRMRAAAVWVLTAVVGGVLISNALKLAFERPRPDLVLPAVKVFTSSFPSGHAMLSAVTYLTLGALLATLHASRRGQLYFIGLAIVLTIAVGISRVYLGVHYPTDVLAGWCVGAAWAILCWSASRWLQRSGKIEPPRNDATGGD
jgi:undecaprenyl-diphosphatase